LDILSKAINSRTLFNKFTTLNIGKDKILAFAKVVQKDPVKDEIKHIDFQAVDKKSKVSMKVPVRFINKELCEDIKLGGQLNAVVDVLELVALPSDMPSYVDYDLSKAKVGVSIRVQDLGIDKKVLVRKDSDAVVATILAGKKKGSTEEAAATE
jgi:large subunit ribosomal protein L25